MPQVNLSVDNKQGWGRRQKRHKDTKKAYCNVMKTTPQLAVDNNHDNDEENPENGDKIMIMSMKNLHGWFKGKTTFTCGLKV